MTHLNERIIPHLGGVGRDPSLCCSHSPQPALLGQETSLHGVPAPEDTPKRTALSGNCDTPRKRNTGDKAFPRSEEEPRRASNSVPVSKSEVGEYVSKYCGVDSGTAASTLQSYEVDSGITESIRILNIDHEMAESVHGTEKKRPRQFIGALRGAPNVFRRH